MKKFRILAFQRYKIFHSNSRNNRDMIKWKKSIYVVTIFYGWVYIFLDVNIFFQQFSSYIVRDKKKSPPLCNFFCFNHIFVIPWVWVENLISFESWDFELHSVKNFFVFWRYFELLIFEQNHVFFYHIKKYHFSSSY